MAAVTHTSTQPLMERVAMARLRRFDRIAEIADQSASPLWQNLARIAARSAFRDYVLAASSGLVDSSEQATAA
jgi:hypothetical protein